MSLVELNDLYEIRPDNDIKSLDSKGKRQLLDSAMETGPEGKKGLIITFDLSSSFRRTNNRLYTAHGQRSGVDTWTEPYPKPILRNHDKNEDPLGRIIEVKWVSNDDQAMRFFDNMTDFMSFKRTMDSGDPKKIYKEMHRRNLLTNDEWPGLGRLVAKARISDPDAIEKFLDGRYLTFSAGSHTDRYACGICGSDWADGDICEHTPGSMSEDGLPAVFVTGKFHGSEASVVTTPANSLSQIRSMEFGDSVELKGHADKMFVPENPNVHFTDASVDTGVTMSISSTDLPEVVKALKAMDARDVARAFWDNTLGDEQADALQARTHFETAWLIRVHDALHSEYDWRLRYTDGEDLEVPTAVFKLHGDLHDLSMENSFRDSLLNGPLDGFDGAGAVSEEYMIKSTDSQEAAQGVTITAPTPAERMAELLADAEALSLLKKALEVSDGDAQDDQVQGSQDQVENKDEHQEEEEEVADGAQETQVDAQETSETEDETSQEDATSTEDESEASPLDVALAADTLTATQLEECKTLIADSANSDAIKAVLLKTLESKEIVEPAAEEAADSANDKLAAEHEKLLKDHAEALRLVEELQKQLDSKQEKSSELDTESDNVQNEDSNKTDLSVDDISAVENVSESSAQVLDKEAKALGPYEKKIVSRYKELRDNEGEAAANNYLRMKILRGHLPRTFDVTPHIQENE